MNIITNGHLTIHLLVTEVVSNTLQFITACPFFYMPPCAAIQVFLFFFYKYFLRAVILQVWSPDQCNCHQLEFIRTADSGLIPMFSEAETLGLKPGNLCFNKPSRRFWYILKIGNHLTRDTDSTMVGTQETPYLNPKIRPLQRSKSKDEMSKTLGF